MNANLDIPTDRIEAFCRANRIVRLAVFGSALREDFGPQSDVDVLVRFEEGASVTLFDMNRMAAELENMFGREVDLVSQRGVERSTSQLRRKAILDSAEPLYEF